MEGVSGNILKEIELEGLGDEVSQTLKENVK